MLIDWFTVGAQLLNFLILVWLMKRFLYKPILRAIDEREKRIAGELADAAAKKAEAQKSREEFEHKNEEFDHQRAALLSKATDEANVERERLLKEARLAVDALTAKRQDALRVQSRNLSEAISRRTQQEVFAIARKALTDLASTSLEERVAEVFIRRIGEMKSDVKSKLGDALKASSGPALVRSAFELPAPQRTAIQNALNQTFSAEIGLRFETDPNLVSGIEFSANGQKVAWSIAEYLTALGKGVDELLKEHDTSESKAAAPDKKTQLIAERAYELYEHRSPGKGSASQDWKQAEQEIRDAKADPRLAQEAAVETKPAAKPEGESQPEAVAKPSTPTEPKFNPDAAPELKPDAKAGSAPEVVTAPAIEEPVPEKKS
ncbi:ATP synthase subunit B [soil metagenome]